MQYNVQAPALEGCALGQA